jgi:hypothetical protein
LACIGDGVRGAPESYALTPAETQKGNAVAKNRASNLREDMKRLRGLRDEIGPFRIKGLSNAQAKKIARSLLRDSGLDIDDPKDVITYLAMVAIHLHYDEKRGAEPNFPIDDFSLLKQAHSILNGSLLRQKSGILKRLHANNASLRDTKPDALRTQFNRALSRAINGDVEVKPSEMQELATITLALSKLNKPKAKRPRESNI